MKNRFNIKLVSPENDVEINHFDMNYIWHNKLDSTTFIDRNIKMNGIYLVFRL